MTGPEIEKLLGTLDGRGSDAEFSAVSALLKAVGDEFPALLLKKYRSSRKWGDRASCVYHAIHYAKNNESAYRLGVEALSDRSKHVRYRACMLLAFAQRPEAIPFLESLRSDGQSGADASAAIDAVASKNHNYFVDRDHSGKLVWNIQSTNSP